jgi:hypothetical protein
MTRYVSRLVDGVWALFELGEGAPPEEDEFWFDPTGRPEEPVRSVNPVQPTRKAKRSERPKRPDPIPEPRRALESCGICEPPGSGKYTKGGERMKCTACDGDGKIPVVRR